MVLHIFKIMVTVLLGLRDTAAVQREVQYLYLIATTQTRRLAVCRPLFLTHKVLLLLRAATQTVGMKNSLTIWSVTIKGCAVKDFTCIP